MKERIEELISKIRKEYDVNEKYYIDIVRLAKEHGITIGKAYLKGFDGFLTLNGNKN